MSLPLHVQSTNPRSTHLTSSLGQYHHPSHVEIKINLDELRAMVGEMLHTSPPIWGHDAGSHFDTAPNWTFSRRAFKVHTADTGTSTPGFCSQYVVVLRGLTQTHGASHTRPCPREVWGLCPSGLLFLISCGPKPNPAPSNSEMG